MNRKNTLHVITIMLVFLLCSCMLAGCGGGETPQPTTEPEQTAPNVEIPEVPGEIYDAGNVQALVPEGWKAFPQSDVFSEEEGATDPDVINICKGGKTDLDLLSKPFVRIDYYGPDTQMGGGLKDWYSNVEDLAPIQCGKYTWEGFTTTDYGLMAILVAEDGKHQYQASVYLEVDGQSISLDDLDVQAILASVAPSDGSAVSGEEPVVDETIASGNYDWWEGDWYGWWCIKNGTGVYQEPSELNLVWDTYAEIDVYNDNTGFMELWDTGTSKDDPMIYAYDIVFQPGLSDRGQMVSSRVVVFPNGHWNQGAEAATMDERIVGWTVDPADSTVSHFENMLEIKGHYESPENAEDAFDYYIYLRPWGTVWDDVRNGDTSGCIYKDMMPLYHDNWYVSLLNLGHERPVSSFQEGIDIINEYLSGNSSTGSLDPADKAGADGKVDMATLKAALQWCKDNASYTTSYDEIAAQFGVHGKQEESYFENNTIYRWWATEDAYVKITFTLVDDGSELWNVTQYDGIS